MHDQQQLFRGGGHVGDLMRSHDWSTSPLGPPASWPSSLRTVVDLLLQSRFPMFVAWGSELGFLYNDSYAEILGAKHPAALGNRFEQIWSEIWSDISPLISAAMNGQASYHEDLPLTVDRKGFAEQAWFTFSYSPVRDDTGEVAGMFCAVWETTQKVLAERSLRESEEQLREAGRRKDEFLALLAHELRNPLAPIRTGLELIRVAGNSAAAVDRVRGVMERQVGHMVRLIDDLLDVSRITSGKIRLQREPTSLRTLVNNAVEANRTTIAEKDLALRVDVPDLALDVDPTRFVQVISNLLHNATKFTEAGGSIGVSAQLTPADAAGAQALSLSISDSGIGIPVEFQPQVFELFSQGARNSSEPGLGIGLALARRLVEMHGGEIEVRSQGPGHGSEFVVRVPVSEGTPLPDVPVSSRVSRVDCRVLVIDDNSDAASTVAMLIEQLGGECMRAHDGESGLRGILEYRPALVLLDIGMPGMDGYETCRRIRQDFGEEIVVVALTGFGQEQDKDAAITAGFDAHLTKPADPAALLDVLRRCSSSG